MKKFELNILITFIVCVLVALVFSCVKPEREITEEIATARAGKQNCFTVCNPERTPDLRLITNATQNPPLSDIIDSTTYFWLAYKVRVEPIRLTQNYITPGFYYTRYGWDSGVVVNRVTLQCLLENLAPFGCQNDWEFYTSQGYLVGSDYFFDGLFEFDTYEKGNGNNWKFLYSDYKKAFYPGWRPHTDYMLADFCYYDRGMPAQTGDFYNNPFRFPNHDGVYKLVIKFNPLIKNCRAVKETNYSNNEETVYLEIKEGSVRILSGT